MDYDQASTLKGKTRIICFLSIALTLSIFYILDKHLPDLLLSFHPFAMIMYSISLAILFLPKTLFLSLKILQYKLPHLASIKGSFDSNEIFLVKKNRNHFKDFGFIVLITCSLSIFISVNIHGGDRITTLDLFGAYVYSIFVYLFLIPTFILHMSNIRLFIKNHTIIKRLEQPMTAIVIISPLIAVFKMMFSSFVSAIDLNVLFIFFSSMIVLSLICFLVTKYFLPTFLEYLEINKGIKYRNISTL